MGKRRLAVVLLLPAAVEREVDGLRRALGDPARARVSPHITLVPPVNVRDDDLDDALAHVRRAASRSHPLTLTLGPPASFLPVTPVVHLPVGGDDLTELNRLRVDLLAPPLDREAGRPFVPHVTVRDDAPEARISAALVALADFTATFTTDRVHVMEEQPGRVWLPIADAALASPRVVGRGGLELELAVGEVLDPQARRFRDAAWDEFSADQEGPSGTTTIAVVARRGGEVVGVAEGTAANGHAYLSHLIVSKGERGTGVGHHLLAEFERRAIDRGFRHLTLRTRAVGPARRFYEARGWVLEAALPRYRYGVDFVQLRRDR